ncbi:MAG: hypothetical protein JWP87_3242 [Labilithrix sp.]|nr:hypothetical protein [Labilithrix sp.]
MTQIASPSAPFHRLAVATDFAVTSAEAVKVAVAIAMRCGAELTVVNVVEPAAYPQIGPDTAALKGVAQGALDAVVTRVNDEVPAARGVLLVGAPGEELVSYAEQSDVDLVVCATHGRKSAERWLLGSVAEKLVRSCHAPVLTVHGAARPFRRLLVAADFSPSSERAVLLAARMATTFGARLTLVHALGTGADDDALRNARARLEEVASAASIPRTSYDVVVGRGSAASEVICEEAAKDYDLVIIGTHGRSALSTLLLGSVAAKVVRTCEAPVLTARSR